MKRCHPPFALLATALLLSSLHAQEAPSTAPSPEEAQSSHLTPGKIREVTLYQGTALVTRHIQLKADQQGAFELHVTGLPTATRPDSLFIDEAQGVEVRSVTCRQRSSEETRRVASEVARLDQELKSLRQKIATSRNEIALRRIRQNFLRNLGDFVATSSHRELEQGVIQADELDKVTQMHFSEYEQASQEILQLDFQMAEDRERLDELQTERHLLTSGPTEIYDAVIFVEKNTPNSASFDLNYLVEDCGWAPLYNVRASSDAQQVQVEFNALIHQVSGEDWRQAELTLSTASPTSSARNPELSPLYVEVHQGTPAQPPQRTTTKRFSEVRQAKKEAARRVLLGQSKAEAIAANFAINDLAASEQLLELSRQPSSGGDLPSLTEDLSMQYQLKRPVTLVSRRESQLVPVLSLDCPATFYSVAIPVLTSSVFREAEVRNQSHHDLLGGQVQVYLDGEYIGRTEIPTIPRSRPFTLGFGVDGQLRARRNLLQRTESVQGGNRQVTIQAEVVIDNFKKHPVNVRLRERTPYLEDTASLRVSLGTTSHPLSQDRDYLRFEKPTGILLWDLQVPPGQAEQATALNYTYHLEFDKNLTLEELSNQRKNRLRSELLERSSQQ